MKIKHLLLPGLCAFVFGLGFASHVYAQTPSDCLASCMVSCAGTSTDPAVLALCNFNCPLICAGGAD
jgi:hypothetical protein